MGRTVLSYRLQGGAQPLALTLALLALPIRFVCGAGREGIQLPDQDNDDSQKDLPEAHPFSACSSC